jgi:peptidoglycan/xylan/chitin deacetylase (PgdA/CDA1 family)
LLLSQGSAKLYKFLQTKKIKATHFFIGKNILTYPQLFLTAFDILQDDLAVHTYTHPSLSTLSNEQIFAELAFTMQIIHDSTGGRVPRIFRPPFGDTDMRVHSIAKILGLTTIIWNREWVLALSWLLHLIASITWSCI